MDIGLVANYDSMGVGINVDLPHEKVTVLRFTLAFWTLLILFGATIQRDDR